MGTESEQRKSVKVSDMVHTRLTAFAAETGKNVSDCILQLLEAHQTMQGKDSGDDMVVVALAPETFARLEDFSRGEPGDKVIALLLDAMDMLSGK